MTHLDKNSKNQFVILDRDGTIILETPKYITNPEQISFLPGSIEGMKKIYDAGFHMIIITNQSVVGRGIISKKQLEKIHKSIIQTLLNENIKIKGIFYCPHKPDSGCLCRKPKIELVTKAAKKLNFRTESSFMIGDQETDIQLAKKIHSTSILVLTGQGKKIEKKMRNKADHIASDLSEAADLIINHQ